MEPSSTPQRLLAASLGLLLVSCGAVRTPALSGPTGATDLSRYVFVIEEAPDGQLTHAWKPLSDFDLSSYPYRAGNSISGGRIVQATWTRDCDKEFEQCQEMCLGSLRGKNWKHATKDSKEEICRNRCYPATGTAVIFVTGSQPKPSNSRRLAGLWIG